MTNYDRLEELLIIENNLLRSIKNINNDDYKVNTLCYIEYLHEKELYYLNKEDNFNKQRFNIIKVLYNENKKIFNEI